MNNKYLSLFYKEFEKNKISNITYNKYSYLTQKQFLKMSYENEKRLLSNSSQYLIIDRSFYEDYYIFGKAAIANNFFSDKEIFQYNNLFKKLSESCPKFDILIYLSTDEHTLYNRINQRNRSMESSIPVDYLSSLNKLYENFFNNKIDSINPKVLKIKIDTNNKSINEIFCDVVEQLKLNNLLN